MRPRFAVVVSTDVRETLARLESALDRPDVPCVGATAGRHVQVAIPAGERHFWSPQLDLEVCEHPGGAIVYGLIGPHPHVWTMFVGLHGVIGLCGLGALMLGLSQWAAHEEAWGLFGVPIAGALSAFTAGAAFIGQGLGSDEMYRLRAFVDQALDGAAQIDGLAPADPTATAAPTGAPASEPDPIG